MHGVDHLCDILKGLQEPPEAVVEKQKRDLWTDDYIELVRRVNAVHGFGAARLATRIQESMAKWLSGYLLQTRPAGFTRILEPGKSHSSGRARPRFLRFNRTLFTKYGKYQQSHKGVMHMMATPQTPTDPAKMPVDPFEWGTVRPLFDTLQAQDLTPDTVGTWLQQWSDLRCILEDASFAAYRAVTENTADAEAEARYLHFVRDIQPKITVAEQGLRQKLLALQGYQPPEEFRETYRRFRNWAELHRDENVPLQAELASMENEYNKIVGAMSVTLDGQEMTLQQANQRLYSPDRSVREQAWRLVQDRWLRDRSALDALYLRMLQIRRQMARNAGLPDFRSYRWRELSRFSYTPTDCLLFHEAIEQQMLPLAPKYAAWRQRSLRVEQLRPWDTEVDPLGRPALHPFDTIDELVEGAQRIFNHLDPELGRYFAIMGDGNLDLASRPNKAPGAYSGGFHITGKPYIFANCVSIQDDVNTLLHESGHAFHFIESSRDPLVWTGIVVGVIASFIV